MSEWGHYPSAVVPGLAGRSTGTRWYFPVRETKLGSLTSRNGLVVILAQVRAKEKAGDTQRRREPAQKRARADAAGYWSVAWCTEDMVNEDKSLALVYWQTHLQLTRISQPNSFSMVVVGRPNDGHQEQNADAYKDTVVIRERWLVGSW